MVVSVQEIIRAIGQTPTIIGSSEAVISRVSTTETADNESLVWFGSWDQVAAERFGGGVAAANGPDSQEPILRDISALLQNCPARVFIFPQPDFGLSGIEVPGGKTVILVKDSRLATISVLSRFFRKRPEWGRHPSAIIHPEAEISPESYIGPNSTIGKCIIESGCVLYGNNFLYDGVIIGRDVTIHAGTVIGTDGFGYHPGTGHHWVKFEHVGGVIIGNGVEIGSNTCIDRGTIGNTIVGDGTKIDNLVHIAHNVAIGKHCLVIAHAMIGGSCTIGDYAWIAPNAAILQKRSVGTHSTVGLGAVVLGDIPPHETWAGVPARKLGNKP